MFINKLYGIITKFNAGLILNITLNQITDYLNLLKLLIVLCSDLKSLYNYLIKLSIINKKD